MRISLDHADARALRVDLPSGTESVVVRAAQTLRGTVEQVGGALHLEDVAAETIELEALRILLGQLVLACASGATLTGVALSVHQGPGTLRIAARCAALHAHPLDVRSGDVHVSGRALLVAPVLNVEDDEGQLAAERVEIHDFSLRLGEIALAADVVTGHDVRIAWGTAGFRLDATTLDASSLRTTMADVELLTQGVTVRTLSVSKTAVAFAQATIESGHVHVAFRPSSGTTSPATEPLLDLRTLDTLSGQLDVDVAVDLTVPIIGRRQATHRLRIAIEDGALDYTELEHNFAALEDALLDFSVRQGALVLERVNPLFPARGHGKPVVVWDLNKEDLALAQSRRVRLSVLPQARLAGDDAPRGPDARSPIALRELGLLRINARLALGASNAPRSGQVRLHQVGTFVLGGNVFHEPGGTRPGSALGEIAELVASTHALALGTSRLDLNRVSAAALTPIEIAFADVSPTKLEVGLVGLTLEGVRLSL